MAVIQITKKQTDRQADRLPKVLSVSLPCRSRQHKQTTLQMDLQLKVIAVSLPDRELKTVKQTDRQLKVLAVRQMEGQRIMTVRQTTQKQLYIQTDNSKTVLHTDRQLKNS
jgi:hypothetical protein